MRCTGLWLAIALGGCSTPATSESTPVRDEPEALVEQQVYEAIPDEAADQPAVGDGLPATQLGLSLLATMASHDPSAGRATIRDEEAGVIATYRVGDRIRSGVTLSAVGRDAVVIESAESQERLTFADELAVLSADDAFYPDLPRDDDLSNAMTEAVQMQPGPGYALKTPGYAWGTPRTVHRLRDAIRNYVRVQPDAPPVHVGDISKKGGGPFPPHLSHQAGLDVDVGYVLSGPASSRVRFSVANEDTLDPEKTWALIQALLQTEGVAYIFIDYNVQRLLQLHALSTGEDPDAVAAIFQYPRGRGMPHGVIRHFKGHRNHMHVRFHP